MTVYNNKNMNTEKHVSGIVCIQIIDFVKSKKGDAGLSDLEKLYGQLLFDTYTMYPLQDFITLQKNALIVVFGSETNEGYRELGTYTYELYSKTLIGSTLTNIGTTPKELLTQLNSLWNSVADFGDRKITVIDEEKRSCIIEITDDPRNPHYISGIFEAGFKKLGIQSCTIDINNTNEHSYTLSITW